MFGVLLGLGLLVLAVVMFFAALPRQDGLVRPFLKADFAQGLYAVAIVGIGTAGAFMTTISLAGVAG